MVVLLAFAVGVLTGLIVYRLIHSDDARASKLEQELAQSRQENETYREEVAEHFSKTSELVENLTADYVNVYKHLATGAAQLANIPPADLMIDQPPESALATIVNEIDHAVNDQDQNESQIEPPRDYAPKKDGTEGTLSESFSVGTGSKPNAP